MQHDSADYEKHSCNRNKSWNLIKQYVLFYETSIFSDCRRHAEASWPASFIPIPSQMWYKTSFAYFNLTKFLMIPGNNKTIRRSEGGVLPSPAERWWAHTHSLSWFQASLAVQLSSRAQASSSAEASVSWFPKALSKIKLEWLSTYPTFPSGSTDKGKPSFQFELIVLCSGLSNEKIKWKQNNRKNKFYLSAVWFIYIYLHTYIFNLI